MTDLKRRRVVTRAEEQFAEIDPPKPAEPPAPPGTTVTVSWGEETFSPVQYNSFRIGGNSITTLVQEGETVAEAYARAWASLEELGRMQFDEKMRGFGQRLAATKGR
jgi:hypothetical protein